MTSVRLALSNRNIGQPSLLVVVPPPEERTFFPRRGEGTATRRLWAILLKYQLFDLPCFFVFAFFVGAVCLFLVIPRPTKETLNQHCDQSTGWPNPYNMVNSITLSGALRYLRSTAENKGTCLSAITM